jgi:uncharacterized protein
MPSPERPAPRPGWYPDPYPGGARQLRFWDGGRWAPDTAPAARRASGAGWPPGAPPNPYGAVAAAPPPLDRAMAALVAEDARPWGWRPALWPVVALAVLTVLGTVATHLITPTSGAGRLAAAVALNLAVYGLLSAVVWSAGRRVAARYGGWGRAFGLRRPVGKDLGYAAAGLGIAFAARIAVAVMANALTSGRAVEQSQNIRLETTTVAVDVLLVVIVVILAPVIEEIIFRGLLLRAFMTRLGFWPAALLSTTIFAGFHTYEVDTLSGALTLAAIVATLGLTNCVLVRLTDRLTPGILVHATFNALAAAVVIYRASH